MSSSSAAVSATRVVRFVTCLLSCVALGGCAHTQPGSYYQLPQSFPGVQVMRTPTGGFHFRILSHLVNQGQPLYIVDGNQVTVEPSRGIDWFEPEDIIRIMVLKDPSETTVYGPSGVNGVILITTKQSLKRLR